MIELLIWLLFFGLVWYVITLIPLPPPFHIIAQIVLAIILLLALLNVFSGSVPLHRPLL